MSGFEVDDWHNLYGDGWKGEIVPAAFAHPAKFSRALIRHIYQHCVTEGWLNVGDSVVDPFGGVALGALDAMRLGLNWVGCELEPRFVDLGSQNIDAWNAHYDGRFRTWGSARLLQGDSRNLWQVLQSAGLCLSSPPYATSDQNYRAGWARFHAGHKPLWRKDAQREAEYGDTAGQLADLPATEAGFTAAIGSPPYADGARKEGTEHHAERMEGTPHMPARYDLAVSSPPFLQTGGGVGVKPGAEPGSITADPRLYARHSAGNASAKAYGADPDNLGNMPVGEFGAVVSSPPYQEPPGHGGGPSFYRLIEEKSIVSPDYGDTLGQLSIAGDDFWHAARAIVEQTYAVLAPGAHACWVLKRFVRNKQIVDFPKQWAQLCEAVGFEVVHWHRAMLTVDDGTQLSHDGNDKRYLKKKASFFRRLAEKKGSPAIDWEDVVCMVKPL